MTLPDAARALLDEKADRYVDDNDHDEKGGGASNVFQDEDSRVTPIPHEEAACEFCRQINELKAAHYQRLVTSFRIPARLLDAMPSTYDQERMTRKESTT